MKLAPPEEFAPFLNTGLWWERWPGPGEGARFIDTPTVERYTFNLLLDHRMLESLEPHDVRQLFEHARTKARIGKGSAS